MGDKVHVEYTVELVGIDNSIKISRLSANSDYGLIFVTVPETYPAIVKHIPASLKVGDKVNVQHFSVPHRDGTVLAINGDRAWVKFPELDVPLSPLLSNLERVV